MKRLLLILAILLFTGKIFSQKNCDIKKEYKQIFKIEKKKYVEEEYLIKTINTIDANSCLSELINKNKDYIHYLLTNFSSNINHQKLKSINDSIELQNEFIKSLEKDSMFNSELYKLTQKITDKSNYTPDTVSMNQLLNIAVKYFSIIRINKDGYYIGKVCAGINGLKQTETERNAQVEAFCFTSIVRHYKSKQFNIYNEFVQGIKALYQINLGIKNEEKLLRAQGAMYMFMKNNNKLKDLLLFEYENKKEFLPFVLKK